MKKIFFVDADDTLLDFHGASAVALRAAFEDSGLRWKEEYLSEFRVVNGGLWEALERKELTRAQLMERRFPIFLAHLGIAGVDGKAFNDKFLKHLATHPVYIDGAREFLRELNARGRVYIVTNGTAWIQKSRFDIANLWSYARETFISDLIGHDKPSKEYTDYVIARIPDFKREEAVWIGDSVSADMKGARDAGITGIWYNPHGKSATGSIPDYTVASFAEILKLLDEIK